MKRLLFRVLRASLNSAAADGEFAESRCRRRKRRWPAAMTSCSERGLCFSSPERSSVPAESMISPGSAPTLHKKQRVRSERGSHFYTTITTVMLCLRSDRGHLHHNRTPVARLQMASHLSEHDEICKRNVARAYVTPDVLTVELQACDCTAARLEPHSAPALNNAWLISGLWNRAKLKERLETGEARRPEGENAHACTRTM